MSGPAVRTRWQDAYALREIVEVRMPLPNAPGTTWRAGWVRQKRANGDVLVLLTGGLSIVISRKGDIRRAS